MKKVNNSFKYRCLVKLERMGYKVHLIYRCPFDLIIADAEGVVAGVKCKAHNHLVKGERAALLWYNMPMWVASEKYESDSTKHGIKLELVE